MTMKASLSIVVAVFAVASCTAPEGPRTGTADAIYFGGDILTLSLIHI